MSDCAVLWDCRIELAESAFARRRATFFTHHPAGKSTGIAGSAPAWPRLFPRTHGQDRALFLSFSRPARQGAGRSSVRGLRTQACNSRHLPRNTSPAPRGSPAWGVRGRTQGSTAGGLGGNCVFAPELLARSAARPRFRRHNAHGTDTSRHATACGGIGRCRGRFR